MGLLMWQSGHGTWGINWSATLLNHVTTPYSAPEIGNLVAAAAQFKILEHPPFETTVAHPIWAGHIHLAHRLRSPPIIRAAFRRR
jgi:hypothetical protein